MKLSKLGTSTSKVEVVHISSHGFWLYLQDHEYFLPFDEFPWFKDAKIKEIQNVKLLHSHHLFWPELDVDLELESLSQLEQYPLIYR